MSIPLGSDLMRGDLFIAEYYHNNYNFILACLQNQSIHSTKTTVGVGNGQFHCKTEMKILRINLATETSQMNVFPICNLFLN